MLDEAYNEYLPEECRYDSVAWLKEFPNLIVSRTFSKAYGLAGLRVAPLALAQPGDIDAGAIRKGAILGALKLYLDFINLLILLLRIFGRRR